MEQEALTFHEKASHFRREKVVRSAKQYQQSPTVSLQRSMPFFLIPIAVVGWKIYEDHKRKEENAAAAFEASNATTDESQALMEAQSLKNVDQQTETTMCADDLDSMVVENESENPLQEDDVDEPTPSHEAPNREPQVGLLHIQSNPENLTFEIMGNRGSKPLPFPKISYQ